MKKSTKLRLVLGAVLLFNLWLAGEYNIGGIPLLLMTFGLAVAFELLVVKPAIKAEAAKAASTSH